MHQVPAAQSTSRVQAPGGLEVHLVAIARATTCSHLDERNLPDTIPSEAGLGIDSTLVADREAAGARSFGHFSWS
jgi:hypothetical protein